MTAERNAARTWELELDAELLPGAPALTPERAQLLAGLLTGVPGVDLVAVRPHCAGRFVLTTVALEAHDLEDAVDRAAAALRGGALAAGVGPLILVAARSPRATC